MMQRKVRQFIMKHYIIWLKSGECITGDITDDVAKTLAIDSKRVLRFSDNEGTVSVKRNRIEAIALNDAIKTNKCGF
jgi:hypothetical protein